MSKRGRPRKDATGEAEKSPDHEVILLPEGKDEKKFESKWEKDGKWGNAGYYKKDMDFTSDAYQEIHFAYGEVYQMFIAELQDHAIEQMKKAGYADNAIITPGKKSRGNYSHPYIYAKGEIPVLLIAHTDTVHSTYPSKFYCKKGIPHIIYGDHGLGADDRAGVAAILDILTNTKHRPHILLTDGEESGAWGAKELIKDKIAIPDVRILVEMDRRGADDCVFYGCDNPEMQKYVETFGYKKSYGSFTDISALGPALKIGSVNLSIGYYDAHSKDESINLHEWRTSVDRVVKILEAPPEKTFEHIEKKYEYSGSYDKYYGDYGYGYEDEYWGEKGYKKNYGKSNGSVYANNFLSNSLYPFEFADAYGGPAVKWGQWINKNYKSLKGLMDTYLAAFMDDAIKMYPPDFLEGEEEKKDAVANQ